MRFSHLSALIAATLLTILTAATAQAGVVYPHLYVGIDGREAFTSGAYNGLANPNLNRLTFLYAHTFPNPATNHFHGIGLYSYTGPNLGANTAINDTSAGFSIPEQYQLAASTQPLPLLPGTGAYAGMLTTSLGESPNNLYDGTGIRAFAALNGTGNNDAQVLYDNSVLPGTGAFSRYRPSLGTSQIAVELVSITAGLRVGDAAGTLLLANVGDRVNIGIGDAISFNPVFVLDSNVVQTFGAQYRAEFRLIDTAAVNPALTQSGRFSFISAVAVPEPGTVALLGAGVLCAAGCVVVRRRK